MQSRAHSRRKRRRRNHLKTYLAIASLAVVPVLGVLVLFFDADSGSSRLDSSASRAERLPYHLPVSPRVQPRSSGSGRIVYPYSVIAGGARGAQELKQAISKDPVVAEHYRSFKRDQTRMVELAAEKTAYVSYRIGNEVFWTKKKLKLVKGEKLITDGENYARTRCGNRISETPEAKTSPEEPSQEILETAQNSSAEETNGLSGPSDPGPTATLDPPSSASPPGGALVPIIPVVPIVGGGSGPNGGPTPPNPPVTPVTPVPEPGTLLLVASGLAGCLGLRKRFRK